MVAVEKGNCFLLKHHNLLYMFFWLDPLFWLFYSHTATKEYIAIESFNAVKGRNY